MSERYQRLSTLPENIYADGSPLIITAGALLKDTMSGKVLLQLKLRSIAEKTVKAAYVNIQPLDTTGKPLGESVEHQYLDLSANRDDEFGSKNAIFMPDSTTRGADVRVARVIYTDNTEWSDSGAEWSALAYTQRPLAEMLGDTDLADEYRIKYGNQCEYEPKKVRDLWACSCGHINPQTDDKCKSCGTSLAAMLALDVDALKDSCGKRLVRERAEAAAQAEADAKERRRNIIIAAIAVPLLIALIIIVTWFATETDRVESKARAHMANGDLAAAMDVLVSYNKPDKTAALRDEIEWEMYDEIDDYITYDRNAEAMAAIKSYEKYIDTTQLLNELQYWCEHQYIDGEAVAPTCTEEGYSVHTCSVCEYVLTQYIPANGHSEGEAPTCTKANICGDCGEVLEEMLPHKYISADGYTKAPTCTEEGEYEEKCADCGHVNKVAAAKIPHRFQSVITKAATCTEEGERTNTCSMCGMVEKETIPMIAHDNIEKVTKAATCTATGTMQTTCRVCGKTEGSAVIAKIPHSYRYDVIKAATCTESGSQRQVCSVCGNIGNTETVKALGHNYQSNVTKNAACETDGTMAYRCQRCGHSYEETIKAFGHAWKDATCTAPQTCTRCGVTSGSALGHYYIHNSYVGYAIACQRCLHKPEIKLNYTCQGLPATYTEGAGTSITVTSAELLPSITNLVDGQIMIHYKIEYTVTVKGRISNTLVVELYDTNGNMLNKHVGNIYSSERELGPHTNSIYSDDIYSSNIFQGKDFDEIDLPNGGSYILKFYFEEK